MAGIGDESGLRNVVEDLSPQSGGDWDVNGFSFVTLANGDIVFFPNGTGKIGFLVTGTLHERLNIGGNLGFDTVAEFTQAQMNAAALAEDVGGTLAAGEYHYDFTFKTVEGNTASFRTVGTSGSPPDITVSENAKVIITNIPVSPDPRVTARKIYRVINPGESSGNCRLIYTLTDNVTTTWTDDGSLTPAGQVNWNVSNTTGGAITIADVLNFRSSTFLLAVGSEALEVYEGFDSVALGPKAGKAATTTGQSVFIGSEAGVDVTTGGNYILIGQQAGKNIVTGERSIHIGSLSYPASGASASRYNVYIGYQAGYLGPQASGDRGTVGVGYRAGQNMGGGYNVILGYETCKLASQQQNCLRNIVIGALCGQNFATGADNNIIIGYDIDLDVAGGDNQLNIGNLIKGSIDGKTLEFDAEVSFTGGQLLASAGTTSAPGLSFSYDKDMGFYGTAGSLTLYASANNPAMNWTSTTVTFAANNVKIDYHVTSGTADTISDYVTGEGYTAFIQLRNDSLANAKVMFPIGAIGGMERSTDPAEPAEGEFVCWMSNGTSDQTGVADGDVMIASKVGGATKVTILHDHSTAGAWV